MTRQAHERRALEVWRSRHTLVDRMVGLWTGGREELARRLAARTGEWYGSYRGTLEDVAHWPRIQNPKPEARVRVLERRKVRVVCPICNGSPYLPPKPPWRWDERWCPECGGDGVVLAVVDTPRAAMERYGYEVRTWRTRSGEWIAEAVVDGRQVVMVGGESEDAALRYLAGELGVFLDEALTGAGARGNGH